MLRAKDLMLLPPFIVAVNVLWPDRKGVVLPVPLEEASFSDAARMPGHGGGGWGGGASTEGMVVEADALIRRGGRRGLVDKGHQRANKDGDQQDISGKSGVHGGSGCNGRVEGGAAWR